MSATLTGKVFNDLQHTGIYHSHFPGIANVVIILEYPDHTLLTTQSDHYGLYSFYNLALPGDYILYEELDSTSDHYDSILAQPLGLNGSTTLRKYHFHINVEQLSKNVVLDNFHFGHDFSEPFQSTHLAYTLDTKHHSLHSLNLITGDPAFMTLLPTQGDYHLLAFNPYDYFIYGYASHLGQLFKLDATGTMTFYTILHLPHKDFTIGDIDSKGHLYLYQRLDHTCYVIDINPNSLTYMYLLDPIHNFSEAFGDVGYILEPLDILSWCFNPFDNYFYSINHSGQVLCFSPGLNKVNYLTTTGTPSTFAHTLFSDYKGYLYALFDKVPSIYRLTLSTSSVICENFSPLAATNFTQGVRCHHSPTYIQLGSAPDLSSSNASGNYTTALTHNGPRHGITSILSIDYNKATTLSPLQLTDTTYTFSVPVTNHTGEDAYLYAWLDFNSNGIFERSEATEPIVVPYSFDHSTQVELQFAVPDASCIQLGETYIRMRLTTDQLVYSPSAHTLEDMRSIGPASNGQVIDLPLMLAALPPTIPNSTTEICEMNQNLLGHCEFTDPNHGTLTYTLSKMPRHGLANIHPYSGKWSYTPHDDYFGKDTFTISATSSITHLTSSLPIEISVQTANLKITTTPSHCEALAGDTLAYTTTIENTGTVNFSNLTYSHPLPMGISFVPSSVLINGMRDISARPEYGINLPKLAIGEACTLSFQLLLASPSKHFSSKGIIQGSYAISPQAMPTSYSGEGNLVEGDLKNPSLSLELNSNVSEAFIEDTLQYIARITNTGDLPLNHIKLTLSLPDDLQYAHQLTCNHTPLANDLCTGYMIDKIAPDEVVTLKFSAKVLETTLSNLTATLFASYDYLLKSELKSHKDLSTQSTLSICSPKLELTKTSNKRALSMGEVFTYTIRVSNNGKLSVDEVVIKDALPRELQVLEVLCQDRPLLNTLDTGISIGKLPPNTSLELIVKLKVTAIPFNKEFNVQAALGIFNVTLDPSLPYKLIYVESSVPPPVLITDAALRLEKSVSVAEAAVGETVTYNISVTNIGTVALSQVTIRDLLCPEIKFIADSITLDGHPLAHASLMSSITLDTLSPGVSRLISFNALILSRGTGILENTCSAYYTYKPHMSPYAKSGSTTSNICSLTIRQAHLTLTSKSSHDLVFLEDELHYTINITNDGDMDAFNVLLTNILEGCELIDGSFTINSLIIHSVDLSQPINVGVLPRGESIIISYLVKVVGYSHFEDSFTHTAYANFAFDTMDHCIKYDQTDSVTHSIPLALSTFKQLSLDNFLELQENKPDMELINSIGGQISLLKHYTIETPISTSLEGQKLSGHKLLIHALLELTLEYVATDFEQSIHSINYNIPFSTFIVLPKGCPTHSPIHIDSTIENISFKVTSTRSFFANSSILVVARVK